MVKVSVDVPPAGTDVGEYDLASVVDLGRQYAKSPQPINWFAAICVGPARKSMVAEVILATSKSLVTLQGAVLSQAFGRTEVAVPVVAPIEIV